MPTDIYEYEIDYLPPSGYERPEPAERHRQRMFSIFCGDRAICFPPVLIAWAKAQQTPSGLQGFQLDEMYVKKTGDYYIFRSEVSAGGRPFAPVEVICVSLLSAILRNPSRS